MTRDRRPLEDIEQRTVVTFTEMALRDGATLHQITTAIQRCNDPVFLACLSLADAIREATVTIVTERAS
jgi:hypothetical protein